MREHTATDTSLIDFYLSSIQEEFVGLGLTERQFQILYLLSNGYSDKLISSHTGTSLDNVRQHILVLREKLNCSSRIELRMLYMTAVLSAVLNKLNQGTVHV
jgi:DNA-binding NarL/FixJ family response regulator